MNKLQLVLVLVVAGCGSVSGVNSSLDDPTITGVAPDHGPSIGGITVTLTGTNLNAGTPIVVVDGIVAPSATAVSDTQATFVLPPGAEGHLVDITLTNDRGFGTAAAAFTFNVKPVVLSITPAGGRAAGGTTIMMTGRGFQNLEAGVPTITIAGGVATDVQIINDTMLTATTGPSPAGSPVFTPVDVQLSNANGTVTLAKSYTETAHGLLGIDRNQNGMVWIDLTNGNSIPLVRFQRQVGGCALSPSGQLFGWSFNPTNDRELVTVDPLTGIVTSVGTLKDAGNVVHKASTLTFVGNTLYGTDTARFGSATNKLMTIDPTSGAVTVLSGGSLLPAPSAIVAKTATTLFLVNQANSTLNTVDTSTGVMTAGIALTGGHGNKVHGLTTAGTTVYMSEHSFPSEVYSLDTTTGALTVLGNIPAELESLCETPPSF